MYEFSKKSSLCMILMVIASVFYFSPEGKGLRFKAEEAASSKDVKVSPIAATKKDAIDLLASGASVADDSLSASPASIAAHGTSKLRRGINNRLLLPEAVATMRSKNPSSISSEVIFSPRNRAIAGPLTIDEHTISAIEASVDVAALESFLSSNDGAIRLPIANDKEVVATFDQVLSRGPHTTTVIGQVVGDSFSDVLLVFHDGAVSGSVAFHDTNTHYQFAMAGNGDVAIRHIDVDRFDHDCGTCQSAELHSPEIATLINEQVVVAESESEVLAAPAGAIPFDSVIGYSAEARISDGGTANIEARIIASVDNLNLALSNSESGGYFCSLLAIIEEPDVTFSDANFNTMAEILGHLNTANDGILDTLSNLRDELGADQATFVCNASIAGVAGVANRPGRQSVCGRNQMFSSSMVFAHEVGHNLGLRHGWGDTGNSGTNPKNQSNYGWRFDPPNGGKVRTIMAYNAGWGGSRIKYFANPNVSYNGAPTGAPRGFDATDSSESPAYDQKFVLNGHVGGLGAGFNGTNPDLGARNGDYLKYNSSVLVNKDNREALVVLEPVGGANFLPGESTSIFWHGGDHTDAVEIDLYKDGFFHSTIASSLTGEERWYDWTIPSTTGGIYTVRVTLSGSIVDDSELFTIGTPVVSLPYTEGFENGLGAWIQSTADDFDWTLQTGATITDATGPDSASSGSRYLYVEPHDDYNGHNKIAQIDCAIDMSNVSAGALSFDYHMYGANIDYLAVDVHDGQYWSTDVWKLSGAQQLSSSDPWLNAEVDLSDYAGNAEVTIRFRAKQGHWHLSDISIDNIVVDGPQLLPFAESFENGLVGLRQSFDDDLDWTHNSGGTETAGAGPADASEGSFYMYVENHDRSSVYYKTASLEGIFDFTAIAKPELSFDYHMYGVYIDHFSIDVHNGTGDWILDVWKRSNAQHSSNDDAWSNAVIDLSEYAGNSAVKIRFRSKQKKWHAADTAIDNILITDAVGPLVAHWSMDEIAGTNAADVTDHGYDATLSGEFWTPGTNGSALDFDGRSSTVALPASAFATISDEITISMWVYGATGQPLQDSCIYAENVDGERILNVHLPWEDGVVYWDAGYGTTYDRIEKMAVAEEYEGQWNHWVFTKNAQSGFMAIYLNGELWKSGTGKTRLMSGITTARLGSQVDAKYYSGKIDDLRLYNESLDATEVSDLFSSYTTTAGIPFEWLMIHGIEPSEIGVSANADSDSLTNELEWFLGTNPLITQSPYNNMLITENSMSFDYTRRKLPEYSIYAQWSSDLSLGSWNAVGLSQSISNDDGVVETVSVVMPIDEFEDKKFVRIKIDEL